MVDGLAHAQGAMSGVTDGLAFALASMQKWTDVLTPGTGFGEIACRLALAVPPLAPISEWLPLAMLPVIGLAGGFSVGSAFTALLIVLDLIPRLVQLTRAYRKSWVFESAILAGAIYWICADYFEWKLGLGPCWLIVPSVFQGVFVGMFAAALTEVLNVIPIFADRLRLKPYLFPLLLAMVLGKVAGSLIDWLWLRL